LSKYIVRNPFAHASGRGILAGLGLIAALSGCGEGDRSGELGAGEDPQENVGEAQELATTCYGTGAGCMSAVPNCLNVASCLAGATSVSVNGVTTACATFLASVDANAANNDTTTSTINTISTLTATSTPKKTYLDRKSVV